MTIADTPVPSDVGAPGIAAPRPERDHTVVADSGAARLAVELNTLRGEAERQMGILLVEASPDRMVGTMPVEGNRQPVGLLHGGASVVLAETLGSFGATLDAPQGSTAVGIEISATHHRPATSGLVTGIATRIHAGRTLATYDIRITDEAGRAICTSRLTCMIRPPRPEASRP